MRSRSISPVVFFAALVAMLGVATSASILIGVSETTSAIVLHARLPRTVLAILVGAALAVAGAIMQILTRNPLASPQTLGINGTAALAMVLSIVVVGPTAGLGGVSVALVGAMVGGTLVTVLSLRAGANPLIIALGGMALHLLCTALIQGLSVLNDAAVDVMFWLNGSVAGARWPDIRLALGFIAAGLIGALLFHSHIRLISLGAETVRSLGRNYTALAALCVGLVVLLAGASVSIAGPIGFLGLIVPHLVRHLVGSHGAWDFVLCAVLGAVMLVTADIGARLLAWPAETPVGVLTAFVGAIAFLVLAWRTARQGVR